MSTQTTNGRAFEWAVGVCLKQQTGCPIASNKIAEQAFSEISAGMQDRFRRAAHAAVSDILQRENIDEKQYKCGSIVFNSDNAGERGDVRDILFRFGDKTLGLSCKNNHEAMKHSRLSATVDFVKKWGLHSAGAGCSATYWNTVRPLFAELDNIRETSPNILWTNLSVDKPKRFYWPILNAWADEIDRLRENPEAEKQLCRALVAYLVGKYDFYKVICSSDKTVLLQAWNFNKTLATKPTKYPTFINKINDKNGGKYSKTIVFNDGYSINFRIHNASKKVEPSLKFDIKATGLPPRIYQQTIGF